MIAVLLSAGTFSAGAQSLTDAQIIGIYVQVNGFDIESSLLAKSQGKSQDLRDLAAHVAADHIGVRRKAFELGRACRVSLELPQSRNEAAVNHSETLNRLVGLSGTAFDKAYAQHEIAFHRGAIDAVRTLLIPAAKCQALKAHLNAVLPAFEHHLTRTEAIAGQLDSTR